MHRCAAPPRTQNGSPRPVQKRLERHCHSDRFPAPRESFFIILRCHIYRPNTSNYIAPVSRPKHTRPKPLPWPEVSLSQSNHQRLSRAQRGYSLQRRAALVDVNSASVRSKEAGGKGAPRSDVLVAPTDALGVSRGWLVHEWWDQSADGG